MMYHFGSKGFQTSLFLVASEKNSSSFQVLLDQFAFTHLLPHVLQWVILLSKKNKSCLLHFARLGIHSASWHLTRFVGIIRSLRLSAGQSWIYLAVLCGTVFLHCMFFDVRQF